MELEKENYQPEVDDANALISKKLRKYFDGKIVRKDLTKSIKEGANVPVYVLEFLLGQYWPIKLQCILLQLLPKTIHPS